MTHSTMYQFRLDANEKRQAFEVFDELGIKPAQAIRLFYVKLRQQSLFRLTSQFLTPPHNVRCKTLTP